jgi:hypothetical protein
MCKDVTNVHHHGNGDITIKFSSVDQLDDVMYLVCQSFEKHREEDDIQAYLCIAELGVCERGWLPCNVLY